MSLAPSVAVADAANSGAPSRVQRATQERSGVPWLAAPAVSLVVLFVIVPTVLVVALSFLNYEAFTGDISAAGFENYKRVLSSGELAKALGNTIVYALLTVPSTVAIGLLVALAIHGATKGSAIWRTIYFLPVATTLAAMSIVWQFMYYPGSGVIDRTVGGVLGIEDWLHSTTWALPALAVIGNWQGLGTAIIIFLAGLAGDSQQLHEAARLDQASLVARFWHVTWPALKPATLTAVVLTSRNSLAMFDEVKVITNGHPLDNTKTLGFALYQRAFRYLDFGAGAVLALTLLTLLLVVALMQLWTLGRRSRAEDAT